MQIDPNISTDRCNEVSELVVEDPSPSVQNADTSGCLRGIDND